jgi:hypothetical protein
MQVTDKKAEKQNTLWIANPLSLQEARAISIA